VIDELGQPPALSAEAQDPTPGQPMPQPEVTPIDEKAIIREVEDFYTTKSQDRRPYEMQWYLTAAALRGTTGVRYNTLLHKLELEKQPTHRRRNKFNALRAKFLAKIAKRLNSRPRPMVMPASSDREDILNARYSEQFLLYLYRKIDLEEKYEQVTAMSELTGKAFWAIRWDPEAIAAVKNPTTGEAEDRQAGDVDVDVVDAFQMLIDDPGVETIGKQARIMRVVAEPVEDLRKRLNRPDLVPDAGEGDIFQFQRQIANLGTAAVGGASALLTLGGPSSEAGKKDLAVKKEMFWAPCPRYPLGAYALVVSGQLIRFQEQLPYGYARFTRNPFPFEEFAAGHNPGQFWPTTMLEGLVPVQEATDRLLNKVMEQLDLQMHPKLLIPRNARIPESAYGSEAGEKIYYQWIPGMPPPSVLEAQGVSMDTWRMIDFFQVMQDRISNIYPSTVGASSDATSGFQTNLLQEAADSVYGPERRKTERALTRSCEKILHLASKGYTEQRLLTVTDRGSFPAVIEFSQANIDTHAEIVVQIGSALPDQKAARLQAVMELRGSGLLGNTDSPRVRRNVLSLVDLGGLEREIDPAQKDEERAQLENLTIGRGGEVRPPMPWDGDETHVEAHFDQMKSSEFDIWAPEAKLALIEHTILHLRRLDPSLGLELATMFLPPDHPVIAEMQMKLQPPPMVGPDGQPLPPMPPPGGPAPADQGAPPPPPAMA
jgi:hypothetical protein